MLAYVELLDIERLDEAKRKDDQYHFAKLIARGFNDPETLWTEHAEYRNGVLTPLPEIEPDDAMLWRTVQYIHLKNLATVKAH